MSNAKPEFVLKDGVLQFTDKAGPPLSAWVQDIIINSITEHKEKLQTWKGTVASAIKQERGGAKWNPDSLYAVTLEFRFHPANHGFQMKGDAAKLDVENFVKPVVDAVAAGLFCEEKEDPRDIKHWNFDDSNFRTLLIHRTADPKDADQEGVRIFVSVRCPEGSSRSAGGSVVSVLGLAVLARLRWAVPARGRRSTPVRPSDFTPTRAPPLSRSARRVRTPARGAAAASAR